MYLGYQSFNTLPITRFPNIDVPIVSISVTQSGAAPAELETQVTKEIEDAVAGISGVDHITSTISDGLSTTAVKFQMDVPTNQAVQDVKDAIDRIRSDLPASVEEPIVSKIDVEGQAIQTFAVSSPGMTLEEISWFVDDTIKRALQGQSGIGRIDRYGGADREVRVELNDARLNSYGITAADVNNQLRKMNTDLGSGRGQVGGSEQAIRTLGDARSVEGLANTMIAMPNGRFVRLSELGKVTDTYEEPKSFSRFNGNPVVTFAVFRSKGASEVTVAETVEKTLTGSAGEEPGRVDRTGRRFRLLHLRQLRSGDPYAARRRAARRGRRPPVPAQLARDADFGDGPAAVGDSDLLGHGPARLLAEPGQLPRHDACDRYSRRRRDRRNREHRPAHQDGQVALQGGDRGGRRNRPCGHRDDLHDHRGLRAGLVHAGHSRASISSSSA